MYGCFVGLSCTCIVAKEKFVFSLHVVSCWDFFALAPRVWPRLTEEKRMKLCVL